jgi:hypothetical protein
MYLRPPQESSWQVAQRPIIPIPVRHQARSRRRHTDQGIVSLTTIGTSLPNLHSLPSPRHTSDSDGNSPAASYQPIRSRSAHHNPSRRQPQRQLTTAGPMRRAVLQEIATCHREPRDVGDTSARCSSNLPRWAGSSESCRHSHQTEFRLNHHSLWWL